MSSESSRLIVKLDDSNYATWRLRTSVRLKGKALYGYVDGSVEEDEPNLPDPPSKSGDSTARAAAQSAYDVLKAAYDKELTAWKAWQAGDAQAVAVIVESLDPSQDVHVSELEYSKDMWDALHDAHVGIQTGVTAFYTKLDMIHRKYVPGTSMQTHINSLVEDNARLRAAGGDEELPSKFMAQLILFSLPRNHDLWDVVTVSLLGNVSSTAPLLIADVSARLIQEAARLAAGANADKTDKALAALAARSRNTNQRTENSRGGGRSAGRTKDGRIICNHCTNSGHIEADCKIKKREQR